MNGLARYIFRQLAIGAVLVTVGLTAFVWLVLSLRFVELIVNRGVSITGFLHLTSLMIPDILTFILPLSLFISVLLVFSKMIGDRELVVMRTTGMSQGMLAAPAIVLALLAMMVGYGLNLYLLPKSYQQFRELQWQMRFSYSHVLLREGAFNALSRHITVYVRERTPNGQLAGILVHSTENPEYPETLMAERGALVVTDGGPRVIMFNGSRHQVDRVKNRMSVLYFDRYAVDLETSQQQDSVRYREPREHMVGDLLGADANPAVDERDRGRFLVEGHKRLVSPLWAPCFVMIGLGCLISGGITRRSQTRRIILAVSLVVALQAVFMGLENAAAKRPEFIPLLYAASILPILLGFAAIHHRPRAGRRAMSQPAATGG